MSTTSEGKANINHSLVKILDFRHFERFFRFDQSDRENKANSRIGMKKAISDGVNVSVVLDMECGNTSKYS